MFLDSEFIKDASEDSLPIGEVLRLLKERVAASATPTKKTLLEFSELCAAIGKDWKPETEGSDGGGGKALGSESVNGGFVSLFDYIDNQKKEGGSKEDCSDDENKNNCAKGGGAVSFSLFDMLDSNNTEDAYVMPSDVLNALSASKENGEVAELRCRAFDMVDKVDALDLVGNVNPADFASVVLTFFREATVNEDWGDCILKLFHSILVTGGGTVGLSQALALLCVVLDRFLSNGDESGDCDCDDRDEAVLSQLVVHMVGCEALTSVLFRANSFEADAVVLRVFEIISINDKARALATVDLKGGWFVKFVNKGLSFDPLQIVHFSGPVLRAVCRESTSTATGTGTATATATATAGGKRQARNRDE